MTRRNGMKRRALVGNARRVANLGGCVTIFRRGERRRIRGRRMDAECADRWSTTSRIVRGLAAEASICLRGKVRVRVRGIRERRARRLRQAGARALRRLAGVFHRPSSPSTRRCPHPRRRTRPRREALGLFPARTMFLRVAYQVSCHLTVRTIRQLLQT